MLYFFTTEGDQIEMNKYVKIVRDKRNRLLLRKTNIVFSNFEHRHNVAIYPKIKLIYNRIKKSANSTIVAFLDDVIDQKSYDTIKELKAHLVKPENLSTSQVIELPSYYSFTFVRNPYDRVLSAYLEKLNGERILEKYRRLPGSGEASMEGFNLFLSYLDAKGLYENRHWWPQTELLFQPAKDFSFIGKIEQMVSDMGKVLADNGFDPLLAAKLERPHQKELERGDARITSARTRTGAFYSERSVEIVSRLYQSDFETFGYDIKPEWSPQQE